MTKTAPILFPEKNDVEVVKKEEAAGPDAGKGKAAVAKPAAAAPEAKGPAAVDIDFDGLNDRIMVFPPEADNIQALAAIEGGLVYFKNGELHKFTLEDKKDNLVIKGISNGVLSADGKKLLYQAQETYGLIDLSPNQKPGDGALNLNDLMVKIEPLKEWGQIFQDRWRIYRDWFYMPNMHGVDWQRMKDKYGALVPYVSHRADLDYIFGELVGELNVGHAYVDWARSLNPNGSKAASGSRVQSRRQGRALYHQQDLQGRELGRERSLSADRTGRRGQGRRLPHPAQRPGGHDPR